MKCQRIHNNGQQSAVFHEKIVKNFKNVILGLVIDVKLAREQENEAKHDKYMHSCGKERLEDTKKSGVLYERINK